MHVLVIQVLQSVPPTLGASLSTKAAGIPCNTLNTAHSYGNRATSWTLVDIRAMCTQQCGTWQSQMRSLFQQRSRTVPNNIISKIIFCDTGCWREHVDIRDRQHHGCENYIMSSIIIRTLHQILLGWPTERWLDGKTCNKHGKDEKCV